MKDAVSKEFQSLQADDLFSKSNDEVGHARPQSLQVPESNFEPKGESESQQPNKYKKNVDDSDVHYDWYKIVVSDSRPFFLSRVLQTNTKILLAILIILATYMSASYITVKNNLNNLTQVSWAQYFAQEDNRTQSYYVEKMIDVNMGMFQDYVHKNLIEKQGPNSTFDTVQQLLKNYSS